MTACAKNLDNGYACDHRNQDYMPRPRRHKRLTRAQRRRQAFERRAAVVGLVALGVVLGIAATRFAGWIAARNDMRDYGRELRYASYTVQSGDTLWDISEEMAAVNPEFTDVRQYLSLLRDANHIYGDYVQEGRVISIPYYATPSEKMRGGGSLEESVVSVYAKYGIADTDAWLQMLAGK